MACAEKHPDEEGEEEDPDEEDLDLRDFYFKCGFMNMKPIIDASADDPMINGGSINLIGSKYMVYIGKCMVDDAKRDTFLYNLEDTWNMILPMRRMPMMMMPTMPMRVTMRVTMRDIS